MSTTPVWVVNGGATTVSSPPPHPTGFTTPVWVVNATDSVSKLSVPTTIEEPSTSYSPLVLAKRGTYVKGGLYTEPFPFPSVTRDLQFSGTSTNVVYSMKSLDIHSLSVDTQQAWQSYGPVVALIKHGTNAYNDNKLVQEKGIFSFFMPLGQAGFSSKLPGAGIYIPSNALFNVTIKSNARVDTGIKVARTYIVGYTLANGSIIINTSDPSLSNISSSDYFTASYTQSTTNLLLLDWKSVKYDGTHYPEMIFGYAKLTYMLLFAS